MNVDNVYYIEILNKIIEDSKLLIKDKKKRKKCVKVVKKLQKRLLNNDI